MTHKHLLTLASELLPSMMTQRFCKTTFLLGGAPDGPLTRFGKRVSHSLTSVSDVKKSLFGLILFNHRSFKIWSFSLGVFSRKTDPWKE